MRPGKALPLRELLEKLRRARPVLLSPLLQEMWKLGDYGDFLDLVGELLPDSKEGILAEPTTEAQIAAFTEAFGEVYFPLAEEAGELELCDFLSCLPIEVHGLDWEDYHYLHERGPGQVMASLLVAFEEELGFQGEGIRQNLVETAAEFLPPELIKRVGKGFRLEALAPLEGLLAFGKALCHRSGCLFVDATMEEIYYPTSSGAAPGGIEWSRENVETLTEEWRKYQALEEKIVAFCSWLESDPEEHFRAVLETLRRRRHGRDPDAVGAAGGEGGPGQAEGEVGHLRRVHPAPLLPRGRGR